MPGECWAFKGKAAVVIQLIVEVNVTAVSIEHASRALLSKEEINSAPKDFSVWVSVSYSFSSYIQELLHTNVRSLIHYMCNCRILATSYKINISHSAT